ncbi:MAG: transglutaminase-like domain-containing protein [Candidatus Brocadiaceae bacterium]|nr:transglutaminase-like domain-containing protein [Candidatus Brocadiaceae bacterium]
MKDNSSRLDLLLLHDMEDGRLDMPLAQAALIASGVNTEKKMHVYLAKIDSLISRINRETNILYTSDSFSKAESIFDWLQSNANEGVYPDCYDFRDTLNLRIGNCLAYSIRFTILCRYYAVDAKNIFVPGHIYNLHISGKKKQYFEHTHSDGIVKKNDLNNSQKKFMRDEELVAEIFLYRAREEHREKQYDASTRFCQYALLCNPNDSRPVILLLNNYIAKEEYTVAFHCLDEFLIDHPNDKDIFQKTYALLRRFSKEKTTHP